MVRYLRLKTTNRQVDNWGQHFVMLVVPGTAKGSNSNCLKFCLDNLSCFPQKKKSCKKKKKKKKKKILLFYLYFIIIVIFLCSCFLLKYLLLEKCKMSRLRSGYVGQKYRKTTVL